MGGWRGSVGALQRVAFFIPIRMLDMSRTRFESFNTCYYKYLTRNRRDRYDVVSIPQAGQVARLQEQRLNLLKKLTEANISICSLEALA